jgi:hypothetical protein
MKIQQRRSIAFVVIFAVSCMVVLSIKYEIKTRTDAVSGSSRPAANRYIQYQQIPVEMHPQTQQPTQQQTQQQTQNPFRTLRVPLPDLPKELVDSFDTVAIVSGEITLLEFPRGGYYSFNITAVAIAWIQLNRKGYTRHNKHTTQHDKKPTNPTVEFSLHSGGRTDAWRGVVKIEVKLDSVYIYSGSKLTVRTTGVPACLGITINR